MDQLSLTKLLAENAPGGKYNRAKVLYPGKDGTWWMGRNRFGRITKERYQVTWKDGLPVFGDVEYHIYRQREGEMPELVESVWGAAELRRVSEEVAEPGARIHQTTTKMDGSSE